MTKKILLADDLLYDVVFTMRALQDCAVKHEIVVTGDGYEALTQLRMAKYDLVLLDLKMPRVDGFEVLKEMRFTPSLSDIPVIILSGSDLEVDRTRAQVLGAVEYVHKETDYTEFKHNLKHALSKHGMC